MTILLKRNRNGSSPAEVQITAHRYTKYAYILIQTNDGLDFSIGGPVQEVLDKLYRLQAIIKTVGETEETGILQGEAEPIEPEHFNLITADDLEGRSTAEKLALLIERFSQSRIDDLDPDLSLVDALKADYKARTGREYRPRNENGQGAAEPSDLDLIRPILPEIFDDQGEVVWGAQQRVAEALGLPGTGGAYRKRILDVLEQAKSHCLPIVMAK